MTLSWPDNNYYRLEPPLLPPVCVCVCVCRWWRGKWLAWLASLWSYLTKRKVHYYSKVVSRRHGHQAASDYHDVRLGSPQPGPESRSTPGDRQHGGLVNNDLRGHDLSRLVPLLQRLYRSLDRGPPEEDKHGHPPASDSPSTPAPSHAPRGHYTTRQVQAREAVILTKGT